MKSMVEISHDFLKPSLHAQAICIDATLGHGKDTKFFLSQGVRKVYGFEIQEDVCQKTKEEINDSRLTAFSLGHENMDQIQDVIDAIVFNFGYCPNGDESITTQASTSLMAVKKGLNLLKRKGRMALVFYPHESGVEEAKAIEAYLASLDDAYELLQVKRLNKESPYLIGIIKK